MWRKQNPGGVLIQTWLKWLGFSSGLLLCWVTPSSFTQQERFKNRKVHCMRPSKGEALALIFCFPAGTQALLLFPWLPSNSKIWHVVFSWKGTGFCVALKVMLCKRRKGGEKRLMRKRLQSPSLSSLFFLHGTCMDKYTQQEMRVLLHWLNGCGGLRLKGQGGRRAVPHPDWKVLDFFFYFQACLYRVCRAAHHHGADWSLMLCGCWEEKGGKNSLPQPNFRNGTETVETAKILTSV